MGEIENRSSEWSASHDHESIKRILEETAGKSKSYRAEDYQAAHELLEEEKEESMKERLETVINYLKEVGDTFENPDIATNNITRRLFLAKDNVDYFLRHYALERREEFYQLFSHAQGIITERNSIFSKNNKNRKQFRLTGEEREKKLVPIGLLIKELIQKVESLRIEQKS